MHARYRPPPAAPARRPPPAPPSSPARQVAVENCDAVLEYASSALPLVLFFNILMQGSLMLAATSCAKHAALLMMKAQSLGAPAI